MKSKILIAQDGNRMPVIKIQHATVSDDLKDLVLKDFIHLFNGSPFATMYHTGETTVNDERFIFAEIAPIPSSIEALQELRDKVDRQIEVMKSLKEK